VTHILGPRLLRSYTLRVFSRSGVTAMMVFRVACLAIVICLTGCAGISEEQCLALDWRTVGFEDGARGRPVQSISSYRQACGEYGVTADLDAYRSGHAEGFDEGHRGARYQGVCPGELEPDFLAAYNSGRHLRDLETTLSGIENQIAGNLAEQQNIKKRLTAIGIAMVSDGTSAQDRLLMVTESAELGERYGELSEHNEALEQERIASDAALRDYQETLAAGF
jgi:hypothetical protein